MSESCYRCGGSENLTHFDYNRLGEADRFCEDCSSCHKYEREFRCDGCLEVGHE